VRVEGKGLEIHMFRDRCKGFPDPLPVRVIREHPDACSAQGRTFSRKPAIAIAFRGSTVPGVKPRWRRMETVDPQILR
jgi:hypothetical protein